MIYISSSCIQSTKIRDSVGALIHNGFRHIELTSGTDYYGSIEKDLLMLKDKYNAQFLLHNYFPPAKRHFVINLASLNNTVFRRSLESLKGTLDLCKRLSVRSFGFHAGFFVDLRVCELGKTVASRRLYNKSTAIKRFCEGFEALKRHAGAIRLYIENNVFSPAAHKAYPSEKPFMLADYNDYADLRKRIDFDLLLDIPHLKVTSTVLHLDFKEQLAKMLPLSDYLHLSDVDAFDGQHRPLREDSPLISALGGFDLRKKKITLEIYGNLDEIKESCRIVKERLQ